MTPNHVIARIPLGYNDFGSMALTGAGREKFDELIAKRLPEDAAWCGDEILAPVDVEIEIDIQEIISEAADEMLECFDSEEYFDADYSL